MTPLEFFQIITDVETLNAIIDNMFIVFFSVPFICAFFFCLSDVEDSARAFRSLERYKDFNAAREEVVR